MINLTMIALGQLKGIGPSFLRNLDYNAIEQQKCTVIEALPELLASKGKRFDPEELTKAIDTAEQVVYDCNRLGIQIHNFREKTYPGIIYDSKDHPPLLFVLGNLQILSKKVACVIGTRKPDEVGIKIASRLGEYLAEHNVSICNGIAEGIDTASINSGRLATQKNIGVLGCGLDIRRTLASRKDTLEVVDRVLANEGLLISEYTPQKQMDKFSLIKSCNLQAACAQKLVLIQSKLTGGSRFTVKAAFNYNREIYIIVPPVNFKSDTFEANLLIKKNGLKELFNFIEVNPTSKEPKRLGFIQSKEDYHSLVENYDTN
ncbi:MAG: hypothetical protein AMXMBFR49_17200 [Chlorobiota bacterium]